MTGNDDEISAPASAPESGANASVAVDAEKVKTEDTAAQPG
jgi:hypothetical protein